jgi:hypothetical protein
VGKRRWRARTPRPVGTSVAPGECEASWSAERQFRFGRETGGFAQFEEFCPAPPFINNVLLALGYGEKNIN